MCKYSDWSFEVGMRVAVITNHADDIYCFRKELIEKLYEEGNEIIISCPYGNKLDLLDDIKFELDTPVIDRRGINPIKDLKLLIYYIKFIKKFKPDIILAYTIKPNVYASIASRLCKVQYINPRYAVISNGWFLLCQFFKPSQPLP